VRPYHLAAKEEVGDTVQVVAESEILVDGLDAEPRRVARAAEIDFPALEPECALVRRLDGRGDR
jgi:hypothetical protein